LTTKSIAECFAYIRLRIQIYARQFGDKNDAALFFCSIRNKDMSFVGIRNDQGCLSDTIHMSTGPYKYFVNPEVIKEPKCPISECNTQFMAGARQADVLSALYNSNPTRVYTRGRPSTQIYGTAPLKREGDGILYAVDVSNDLRNGYGIPMRCVRPETEELWDRMSFIDMPNVAESWRRGGITTRFVPVSTAPTRAATPVPSTYVK
jgi:hypothetical protein